MAFRRRGARRFLIVAAVLATGSLVAKPAPAQQRVETYLAGSGGYLRTPMVGETTGGFAVSLALGGSAVIVGPELLWADGVHLRVRAFEVAGRLRQRAGRVHPHLVASLGAYAWQTRTDVANPVVTLAGVGVRSWTEATYLSGSLGAGVTLGSLDRGISVPIESRWHRNLSRDDGSGSRSLIELRAGIRFTW